MTKTAEDILKKETKAFNFSLRQQRMFLLTSEFLDGNQWVNYDERTLVRREVRYTDPEKKVIEPVTENKIGPAFTRLIHKLETPLPFEVPTNDADDASFIAARKAQNIIRSESDRQNILRLDRHVRKDGFAGGTTAVYLLWDGTKGLQLEEAEDGSAVGLGDIVIGQLDLTEFAVEPGDQDIVKAQWMVIRRAIPAETVQHMFGLKDVPKPDTTDLASAAYNRVIAPDLVKVVTYIERPLGKNKGCIVNVVNGNIVSEKPWNYPWSDELPIEVFSPQDSFQKTCYGRTPVQDALSPQTRLNMLHTVIYANLKEHGFQRLMVDQTFVDEMPAGPSIIPVAVDPTGGFKPEFLQPGRMSPELFNMLQVYETSIDDKVGAHEILSGTAPRGVESAAGFNVLIEQAASNISPYANRRAEMWERFMSKYLWLLQDKLTPGEKRPYSIVLPGQRTMKKEFTKEELGDHTRVTLPRGATMPRNKAASMLKAQELVKMGMIQPGDFKTFAIIADLDLDADATQQIHPDVAKARRENYALRNGNIPKPPAQFDDHRIHIDTHLVFMKSSEWDELDVATQENFVDHVQAHTTMSAEQTGNFQAQHAVSPALAASPQLASIDPQVAQAAMQTAPGQNPNDVTVTQRVQDARPADQAGQALQQQIQQGV